jgi:hypothetical protein
MRDGYEIPMIIKYDKRTYKEDSPWVIFTEGSISDKNLTNWNINDVGFLSRGIVCAYPLIRGKSIIFKLKFLQEQTFLIKTGFCRE